MILHRLAFGTVDMDGGDLGARVVDMPYQPAGQRVDVIDLGSALGRDGGLHVPPISLHGQELRSFAFEKLAGASPTSPPRARFIGPSKNSSKP